MRLLRLTAIYVVFAHGSAIAAQDLPTWLEENVKVWKSEFSDKVDFNNPKLQAAILLVAPAAKKDRASFANYSIDPEFARFQLEEIERIWLKDGVIGDNRRVKPSAFILRDGLYHSDLCYSFQSGKLTLDVTESSSGLFVAIRSRDWKPTNGISGREIASALLELFRLQQSSPGEVVKYYGIPETAADGAVFTKVESLNDYVFWKQWQGMLTGFVGRDALYVVVPRPPGKNFRGDLIRGGGVDGAGTPFDKNWLNGYVFTKKGDVAKPPIPGESK